MEQEQEIRGDLVRWLCVESDAQSRIDPLGVRIQSAKISGELNLSFVVVRFPLTFCSCKFANPLRLILAEDCRTSSRSVSIRHQSIWAPTVYYRSVQKSF